MADASNVRHDTIVVPKTMSPAQVRTLAQRKAQAQVGDDDMVAFLHLHGSRPVGGEYGTEVDWRYSYQVLAICLRVLRDVTVLARSLGSCPCLSNREPASTTS